MKNIKEIYQALLSEKKIIHKETNNIVYIENDNLSDIETFDVPEDWEIYEAKLEIEPDELRKYNERVN
jgi:hypothetical protein